MDSIADIDSIRERLTTFLREDVLARGIEFTASTPLSSLGVDSAALVEILLFVERHWGVEVPESRLTHATLESVDALARCVHELASAGDANTRRTQQEDDA